MLHKNFGCGVLYSWMEILPKVDKAEPHWNDEHSDLKPLQRRIIGHSLVFAGRVIGGRGRGSVVGISVPVCGVGW